MTEINKEIEKMAEVIKSVQDSQVFHDGEADRKQLSTALHNAGYRKQEDTVNEFAEKLLSPLIKAYNQSYKASGYDMEAAISASEIKHYIDHIKQTAEQFGKEQSIKITNERL